MVATATNKKPVTLSRQPSQKLRPTGLRALPVRLARSRYDAAATTHDNRRHWANADALSADAAASGDVRRTLRNRARYEVANNSYAKGIVLTLANDTIGTGPRLQMLSGDDRVNRSVEREFETWALETGLAEKLRTMRMARAQDGEAFAVLVNNPVLEHAVKLDLRLIEADQVTSPFGAGLRPQAADYRKSMRTQSSFPTACRLQSVVHEIDGVVLDNFGNPSAYRVLKEHPGGGSYAFTSPSATVPASHMIHVYRQDRPGQHRGVPEITPALPLFAQLRRYTLAVLSAAETAADLAWILYTDTPPGGEPKDVEPMDTIRLERGMLMTMPGGWKMSQIEPAQPATTYAEFKNQILNEIARCLNMPFNVAAGNSSGYTYASGRLDHQTYFKSIRVDQAFMAEKVLDRILAAWLWEYAPEAGLVGEVPVKGLRRILPPHQWFLEGMEHVDPAKEARAQETRLGNHTTTLANEYARQGKDWKAELRQRAREVARIKELGLPEGKSDTAPGSALLDEVEEEINAIPLGA